MKRRNPFTKAQTILLGVGILVGFIGLCIGILMVGQRLDANSTEQTTGSLENRFASDVQITIDGKIYNYRDHDLTTILVIGVDHEELVYESRTARSGTQADTLLLLVADRVHKTLTPIQLDRDTMVDVDVYGLSGQYSGRRQLQICLAQAFGKTIKDATQNTITAVSRFLCGVPIDYYIVADLGFITALNDLLGGVTVTVEDDLSASDPAMVHGATVKLQGKQAETFVRSRMHVADGTNTNRMRRQRVFLNGAFDLFLDRMNQNSSYINDLLSGLSSHYYSNMTCSNMTSLINRLYKYEKKDYVNFTGTYSIGKNGYKEHIISPKIVADTIANLCF